MSYTKEELMGALEEAIDDDVQFRIQLEKAVENKNQSWIVKLIKEVAMKVWGWIENTFVGWCLRKFLGLP
jgi:uncharacterized protein YajQ (UPF0234 family)